MTRRIRSPVSRRLPWVLLGGGLLPAVATAAVGIVILALWRVGGDIALGVLTLCFAVFTLAGTSATLYLLARQNRFSRLQADFVVNVSHELRTPLSSIRMYVETLRMGRVKTQEDTDACLEALERETHRLAALVERLLSFDEVHRFREAGATDEVDPEDLVQRALQPLPAHQRARVSVVVEPDLPLLHVNAPEGVDALANLVRNALIYSDDDLPVIVNVRFDALGVDFHVRDRGPGIAKREQKRIFRRFYRAPDAIERNASGMGIGLAAVRDFADAHGGRVRVNSARGRGTTFTLWLPTTDPPSQPPERPRRPRSSFRPSVTNPPSC